MVNVFLQRMMLFFVCEVLKVLLAPIQPIPQFRFWGLQSGLQFLLNRITYKNNTSY
jgi:hypothetical protein